MNNDQRRLPSAIVLVVALSLSAVYAHRANLRRTHGSGSDAEHSTLQELEQQIATGTARPETWSAYGHALFAADQYDRAALAFEHVIESQPSNREARVQAGLSLAAAGDADRLLAFLRDQLYFEPKLAVELLDRAEMQRFLTDDPRFSTLQKDARAQAMD
jgi:tetratricopeptide (TPR) repeat protein